MTAALRAGDTARARSARKAGTETELEEMLADKMTEYYDDPVGFVWFAFDWGHGELADQTGPDDWQVEFLQSIGDKLKANPDINIREATASGHGIGKTACTAWLIIWAMSTRPHLSGVVTANTMSQLSTKTWRELALWYKRAINAHWFKWSATKFWHIKHPETWFTSAEPNTEHNSEAFAGRHAKYKLILFDEASAIPDKIFEVTEGAMTDPRSIWCIFGNPTKNTGKFKDCFGPDRYNPETGTGRWTTRHIDSRTAKMTNKTELGEWIKAYGIDSDFVRVRVLGFFPRLGAMQFIPTDAVDRAMLGEVPYEAY